MVNAFKETLESGIPDYFETTSWLQGGRTVSLARLVAPIAAGAGRELIALWEIMEPPSRALIRTVGSIRDGRKLF